MQGIFEFLIWMLDGIAVTMLFEFVLKTNKKLRERYYNRKEIILGYHTHHSIYGLVSIIAGCVLFFTNQQAAGLFFVAFGIGIAIQHTLSAGRFVFIEKYNIKYKRKPNSEIRVDNGS